MKEEAIIEFAKLIVDHVRDLSIQSCDVQLYTQNMKSPIANRWKKADDANDKKNFGELIISDTVDNTIFYFLQAIDSGLINISFKTSDNKIVSLSEDLSGELSGYYIGEWRSKFSNERCSNDLEQP